MPPRARPRTSHSPLLLPGHRPANMPSKDVNPRPETHTHSAPNSQPATTPKSPSTGRPVNGCLIAENWPRGGDEHVDTGEAECGRVIPFPSSSPRPSVRVWDSFVKTNRRRVSPSRRSHDQIASREVTFGVNFPFVQHTASQPRHMPTPHPRRRSPHSALLGKLFRLQMPQLHQNTNCFLHRLVGWAIHSVVFLPVMLRGGSE
ncbi:unnamed protein product [Protopolystoma xenopodis]|uniref:Uncharacterized protein n=1 Tax=Protopolystoma xenopodis TaxID=117903 RepID=A0A448WPP4_9PLAT|nr:unnamed protein product [Protopolystoma xenopodis]